MSKEERQKGFIVRKEKSFGEITDSDTDTLFLSAQVFCYIPTCVL